MIEPSDNEVAEEVTEEAEDIDVVAEGIYIYVSFLLYHHLAPMTVRLTINTTIQISRRAPSRALRSRRSILFVRVPDYAPVRMEDMSKFSFPLKAKPGR